MYKRQRTLYIGLDAATLVGHPSIVATSLLLIPTTLLLAVILPGNVTLPLAELSGLTFFIVWAVVPSQGNVFRGWLIGTLFMTVVPVSYTHLSSSGTKNNTARRTIFVSSG